MRKGLCLVALGCALCTGSYAQKQTTSQNSTPRNFTGQVFDSKDGSSLIGCTVRVKGKQTATITDVNGNYSITAKPGDILIISYVGLRTQETTAQQNMRIVLSFLISRSSTFLIIPAITISPSAESTCSIGIGSSSKSLPYKTSGFDGFFL